MEKEKLPVQEKVLLLERYATALLKDGQSVKLFKLARTGEVWVTTIFHNDSYIKTFIKNAESNNLFPTLNTLITSGDSLSSIRPAAYEEYCSLNLTEENPLIIEKIQSPIES